MFSTVFNNLIILFVMIAVGYICRKTKIINDEINSGLSSILLKISLPSLIVVSMIKPFSMSLFMESGVVLAISTGAYFFGAVIGYFLCKLVKADTAKRNIWMFMLAFPNVGFMGYPVIMAVYGQESLFYAVMVNASFNFFAYSLGVKLITNGIPGIKINIKGIFLNNAVIATVIGFVFFMAPIEMPQNIMSALSYMGNMTVPLSMIVVGAILAKSDIRYVFTDARMYLFILVRQVVIPGLIILIFRNYINDTMLGVVALLMAMPAASATAIFAEQYGVDAVFASKILFVSTLLSLLTLPTVSLFL